MKRYPLTGDWITFDKSPESCDNEGEIRYIDRLSNFVSVRVAHWDKFVHFDIEGSMISHCGKFKRGQWDSNE